MLLLPTDEPRSVPVQGADVPELPAVRPALRVYPQTQRSSLRQAEDAPLSTVRPLWLQSGDSSHTSRLRESFRRSHPMPVRARRPSSGSRGPLSFGVFGSSPTNSFPYTAIP